MHTNQNFSQFKLIRFTRHLLATVRASCTNTVQKEAMHQHKEIKRKVSECVPFRVGGPDGVGVGVRVVVGGRVGVGPEKMHTFFHASPLIKFLSTRFLDAKVGACCTNTWWKARGT